MQVSKWGNSLAVRLPATVVDALGLKEGDQIEIQIAAKHTFAVAKAPGTRELLRGCVSSAEDCPRRSSSIVSKRMSEAEPFFDTSVLLYLLSGDTAKADRVETLLSAGEL